MDKLIKEPKRYMKWWIALILIVLTPYAFTVVRFILRSFLTEQNTDTISLIGRMANVVLGLAGMAFWVLLILDIVYMIRMARFKKRQPPI